MEDVRRELGVKSVRWKVEKRVLERIGHVMRMEDGRLVKSAVLGWWDELEDVNRVPGRRRKTVLYWRRLLREAGIDYTRVGQLAADRKEWRALVRRRMRRIEEWEWSRGYQWKGRVFAGERSMVEEDEKKKDFVCEVCGKVCVSKAGVTIHRKRMHEQSEKKRKFRCEKCGDEFGQEANLKNHRKVCAGVAKGRKRRCDLCQGEFSQTGFKRHTKSCAAKRGIVLRRSPPPPNPQPRVYTGKRVDCPQCGRNLTASNLRRHINEACPGQRA